MESEYQWSVQLLQGESEQENLLTLTAEQRITLKALSKQVKKKYIKKKIQNRKKR